MDFLFNSNKLKSMKNSIVKSQNPLCINAFSYKNLKDEFDAGGLLYKSVQYLMLVQRYILNFHNCEYFAQKELFMFNDLKC